MKVTSLECGSVTVQVLSEGGAPEWARLTLRNELRRHTLTKQKKGCLDGEQQGRGT